MRRLLGPLIAALALSIALVMSEVVVRVAALAPVVFEARWSRYRLSANQALLYEPVPNLAWSEEAEGGFSYQEQSNELGYRGPVYPPERSADAVRIVVVGDSVTEGFGIRRWEDIYTTVLERELSAQLEGSDDERSTPWRRAEVMNFGVNGYQTSQEVETLAVKGLQFHPQIVVLQYCLNDHFGDDGGIATDLIRRSREHQGMERSWLSPLLLESALYRFVKYRAIRQHQAARLDEYWNYRHEVAGRDNVPESFARLAQLAQQYYFTPLVAIFPRFDVPLDPYPLREVHAEVVGRAHTAQLPVLDLLPAFQRCAREESASLGADMYHPTIEGHRCAGRALAAHLLSEVLPVAAPR